MIVVWLVSSSVDSHVITPFIVDFYAAAHKLIVEIDGDIPNSEEARLADASRQQKLESWGSRVIRFSSHRVVFEMDAVLREIAIECGKEWLPV